LQEFVHQKTFYTRRFLHQKILTTETVDTKTFTPETFHTTSNSNQRTFALETSCIERLEAEHTKNRNLLHQRALTPNGFYTRKPFHQRQLSSESSELPSFKTTAFNHTTHHSHHSHQSTHISRQSQHITHITHRSHHTSLTSHITPISHH